MVTLVEMAVSAFRITHENETAAHAELVTDIKDKPNDGAAPAALN